MNKEKVLPWLILVAKALLAALLAVAGDQATGGQLAAFVRPLVAPGPALGAELQVPGLSSSDWKLPVPPQFELVNRLA